MDKDLMLWKVPTLQNQNGPSGDDKPPVPASRIQISGKDKILPI